MSLKTPSKASDYDSKLNNHKGNHQVEDATGAVSTNGSDLAISGPFRGNDYSLPTDTSTEPEDQSRRVFCLIRDLGAPVLRTHIAAVLEFQERIHPLIVTKGVRDIKAASGDGGEITHSILGRSNRDLFCYDRLPTAQELEHLTALCNSKDGRVNNWSVRSAGEQYFRSALLRSGRLDKVTRPGRLGYVRDLNGENALDIVARDKETGITYGISVKNTREWLFGKKNPIADCYVKATAHGLVPWLVVPFATPEGIRSCKSRNVRLTVLGRQIMPAESADKRSMKRVITELYTILGPTPFEFLYKHNSITFERSEMASIDVETVRGE